MKFRSYLLCSLVCIVLFVLAAGYAKDANPVVVYAQPHAAEAGRHALALEKSSRNKEVAAIPLDKPMENSAPQSSCTNKASFVKDVTIPDGSTVEPGESLRKVWRYRNTGTCTWNKAYKFIHYYGRQMGAKKVTYLPKTVSPGKTVDVSIPFTAPIQPGSYKSRWKFQTPSGTVMSRPYVEFVVNDVMASLKDEIYYFGGGDGRFFCGESPEEIPAIGTIEPHNGPVRQFTQICLYGFPLHNKVYLTAHTPEGRYTVSFVPGNVGSEFEIYNNRGYRTGRTGGVYKSSAENHIGPIVVVSMLTPPYAPAGWWRIRATTSSKQAEESFKMPAPEPYAMVQQSNIYYPFTPPVGYDCYSTGDHIRLVGGGYAPGEILPLGFYLSSPENPDPRRAIPLVYSALVKADYAGEFVHTIRIKASDPPGQYTTATPKMYGGTNKSTVYPTGFCVE